MPRRTLTPDQLAMIRDTYDAIADEPWFTKNSESRRAFAVRIVEMYQRGLIIPDKLHVFCLAMARRRFAAAEALIEEARTKPPKSA